jgi:hypothetical protein
VQLSVKCRFCDVLLVGREQFMGHMFHNHGLDCKWLETAWTSITAATYPIIHKNMLQVEAR